MPIELDDIRSGYNLSKINSNFQKIEDAWDEKLDRLVNDQGNQMEQQLDMNSNKIINHPPTDLEEPTDLVRVDALSEYGDFTGAIPVVASYVGNGVQTAFPKPVNANDARTFQVYIGGLRQEPYTDYFITDTSVVFQQAPVLDVSVDIYGYNPVLLENSAPVYADPILANFVGDGTTTTFFVSAAGSSTDAAFISIDGVNQTPFADFTNAGGAIQFTEAPPLNSEIFVRIFAPFTNNATDSLVIADGSTEPRTLGDRFEDIVFVEDFGAVGDGLTDDTSAIQNAINSKARVAIRFKSGKTYKVSSLDIGSTYPNNTVFHIQGFGATILASDNNVPVFKIGSDTSIIRNSFIEGLRIDMSNVTGATAIELRNFRTSSECSHMYIEGGDIANNNIGVNAVNLNYSTSLKDMFVIRCLNGYILDDSSNSLVVRECSADLCDIGITLKGALIPTASNTILGGYYQRCRIGVLDQGAWHTTLINPYFEQNTETDVEYNASRMVNHLGSTHLTDNNSTTAIKGVNVNGGEFRGVGQLGARLNLFDFDNTNRYCTGYQLRGTAFGINLGIVDGIKFENNMNGDLPVGQTGLSDTGQIQGMYGTTEGNKRLISISNNFDRVRTDSSATVPLTTGEGIRRMTINSNLAMTSSGTPVNGQSITFAIRSNSAGLTVTFDGVPLDWSGHPGSTSNALITATWFSDLSTWMVTPAYWT